MLISLRKCLNKALQAVCTVQFRTKFFVTSRGTALFEISKLYLPPTAKALSHIPSETHRSEISKLYLPPTAKALSHIPSEKHRSEISKLYLPPTAKALSHIPSETHRSDCLSGLVVKASAFRAADLGSNPTFSVGLFQAEQYQQLKNWYSSGYPARRLVLQHQCWAWSGVSQYTVTGWDSKFDL